MSYDEGLAEMLDVQRQNMSMGVFQRNVDDKFDNHLNNISQPNYKNHSGGVGNLLKQSRNDNDHLPRLGVSKRERILNQFLNIILGEAPDDFLES